MTDTDFGTALDRRRFVELAGAAGAAALAGCSGDGDDGDGSDDGSGDSGADGTEADGTATDDTTQVHDVRHMSMVNVVPEQIQFNGSNPNSQAVYPNTVVFDPFTQYNFARGEFEPGAIRDWAFDGDTFEMQIREDLDWDDGDPVTAEDVAVQLRLGQLTNDAMWNYTESVETPDEKTVVLNVEGDVNQTIVEFDVLTRELHKKADVFGEYLETYENGDEEEAARQLQEFAYQDVVASGPFSLAELNQQQIVTERRDDHPDSENVNFAEYAFQYYDGNQAAHQALINLELDSVCNLFTPPEVVEQTPEAVQMIATPGMWGYGLIPQHDHEHVGDRAVRQAIAYVLDRETIVANVGDTLKQAPDLPVGIPSDDQERWLGDAMDDFEDYGKSDSLHDEAAAVLEDAGYAREDGTWVDADGNAIELPVTVAQGWSDFVTATETIVDQLNDFGFEARVDSRNSSAMFSTIIPNGEFVLLAHGWLPGGARSAFPYYSLEYQLVENNAGITYGYPPARETRGGSESDVTVPARDGSGTVTVTPSERVPELAAASDEERLREIALEQAWVTNVDLPMIPVMEKLDQTFVRTDEWSVPEPGAPETQVKWANTWLPRRGELTYDGD